MANRHTEEFKREADRITLTIWISPKQVAKVNHKSMISS